MRRPGGTLARRTPFEFLHGLGYLYCRAGQPERGLVFLLLAAKIAPHETAVLRSLATVFVETKSANRALTAIDRIEDIEGTEFAQSRLAQEPGAMDAGRA